MRALKEIEWKHGIIYDYAELKGWAIYED